jgi:putative MATE family efflux protein
VNTGLGDDFHKFFQRFIYTGVLYCQSVDTSIFLFCITSCQKGKKPYTVLLSVWNDPSFMQKQNNDINVHTPKRLNLRLRDLNKTLTTLAAPSIVENCLYSLVFVSDTIIVGRLRNENYLAAAALAGIMMFLVTAPFIALSMAATSIVARSWGEAAYETARKHAGCAMIIAFLMAAALFAAGSPFAGPIIRSFGASEDVALCGAPYLRILLVSCLTGLPMMVSNGMLRGMGDTFRPMLITGLMNVVNVVASIMLAFGIFAPKLGFYGVAWGTVIARTFGIFFSLGLLVSAKGLQIRASHFLSLQKNVLGRIWYLAWPAYIERGLTSFYYMLFMKMVAHLGTTILAAHQVALQIENLAVLPAWGLAVATTTITGQAVGAGRHRVARIAVNKIIIAVSTLTAVLCVVFVLFGPQIARVFGATDEVVRLAGLATRLSAIELPFLAITFIFTGALRGVGDTRSPLYVGFVSMLLCRLGAGCCRMSD